MATGFLPWPKRSLLPTRVQKVSKKENTTKIFLNQSFLGSIAVCVAAVKAVYWALVPSAPRQLSYPRQLRIDQQTTGPSCRLGPAHGCRSSPPSCGDKHKISRQFPGASCESSVGRRQKSVDNWSFPRPRENTWGVSWSKKRRRLVGNLK